MAKITICPHCDAQLGPKDAYCPECGMKVSRQKPQKEKKPNKRDSVRCPDCGCTNSRHDSYCMECGCPLDHAAPAPRKKSGGNPLIIIAIIVIVLLLAAAAVLIFVWPGIGGDDPVVQAQPTLSIPVLLSDSNPTPEPFATPYIISTPEPTATPAPVPTVQATSFVSLYNYYNDDTDSTSGATGYDSYDNYDSYDTDNSYNTNGTYSDNSSDTYGYVRATGDVYIRSGPGKDGYDKLKVLKTGSTATYLGQCSTDYRGIDWYYVSYSGVTGWVSSKYSYRY